MGRERHFETSTLMGDKERSRQEESPKWGEAEGTYFWSRRRTGGGISSAWRGRFSKIKKD